MLKTPRKTTDFKRKLTPEQIEKRAAENEEAQALTEKTNERIRELMKERVEMDFQYKLADKLLQKEITKAEQEGKLPTRDFKYCNIYREKPTKVTVKVLVPVKEHPKYNYIGKILGPKGNTLKRLQEETLCRMAVLGKGSIKNQEREDELRASCDPKYAHLCDALHVEVTSIAPPSEAHARIAYALTELRKYLIPDINDTIRQEQFELMLERGDEGEEEEPPRKRSRPLASNTKLYSILSKARSAIEESHVAPHERYEEPPYKPAPYGYHHGPPSRPKYEYHEYAPEYYREPPTYEARASPPPRPSWRPSAYAPSREIEPPKAYAREGRYRSAPYPRPAK